MIDRTTLSCPTCGRGVEEDITLVCDQCGFKQHWYSSAKNIIVHEQIILFPDGWQLLLTEPLMIESAQIHLCPSCAIRKAEVAVGPPS